MRTVAFLFLLLILPHTGKAEDLTGAIRRICGAVVDTVPSCQGWVLSVDREGVWLDVGRQAGAYPGMELEIVTEGRKLKAVDDKEVLGRRERVEGRVRLIRVNAETSLGTLIEGDADRGEWATTSAVLWPLYVEEPRFHGKPGCRLVPLVRGLVETCMERSGRVRILSEPPRPDTPGFVLATEMIDTVGAVEISLKLVESSTGRAQAFARTSVPVNASLRHLISGPIGLPIPYVEADQVSWEGEGLCDCVAVPCSERREWVAVLTGHGITGVQFLEGRLVHSQGASFADPSLLSIVGLGTVCFVSLPANETAVLAHRIDSESLWEGDLSFASCPYRVVAMEGAPLVAFEAEGKEWFALARPAAQRNHFEAVELWSVGADGRPATQERTVSIDPFWDGARGLIHRGRNSAWVFVHVDGGVSVFDSAWRRIWRNPGPFGARVACVDLDGNGREEIALTSSAPVGEADRLFLLEWNGETVEEKWRSRQLEGSILGLCGADLDGDGRQELVTMEQAKGGVGRIRARIFRATGEVGSSWQP